MNKQLAFETILNELNEIKEMLGKKQEKPLTFTEAACYLNISKSYLYKLTSSGKMQYYKPFGKKIYFKQSDLYNWIFKNGILSNEDVEETALKYVNKNRS